MKKCVKCDRKYDDSVLICNDCGLYLIAEVVSDLGDDSQRSNSSTNAGRRRHVVPIEEPTPAPRTSTRQNNTSPRTSGFEASSETAEAPSHSNNTTSVHSSRCGSSGFRRNSRNFIRRYYPIIRVVIPIVLLVFALIWIAANREAVSEFLQCCLISGMVGGALLTFLSARYGHHFNIDVVTGGVIGGMVVGCILKYNILGTATGLLELVNGIGPCIIIIIGIYIAIRGMFR